MQDSWSYFHAQVGDSITEMQSSLLVLLCTVAVSMAVPVGMVRSVI